MNRLKVFAAVLPLLFAQDAHWEKCVHKTKLAGQRFADGEVPEGVMEISDMTLINDLIADKNSVISQHFERAHVRSMTVCVDSSDNISLLKMAIGLDIKNIEDEVTLDESQRTRQRLSPIGTPSQHCDRFRVPGNDYIEQIQVAADASSIKGIHFKTNGGENFIVGNLRLGEEAHSTATRFDAKDHFIGAYAFVDAVGQQEEKIVSLGFLRNTCGARHFVMGVEEDTFVTWILFFVIIVLLLLFAYACIKRRGELLSSKSDREKRRTEVDAEIEEADKAAAAQNQEESDNQGDIELAQN